MHAQHQEALSSFLKDSINHVWGYTPAILARGRGTQESPPQLQKEVSSRPFWPTGEPVSEKKQGNSPHLKKTLCCAHSSSLPPPKEKK